MRFREDEPVPGTVTENMVGTEAFDVDEGNIDNLIQPQGGSDDDDKE